MSSCDVLRALVTQRLTAAAEDIFLMFERTLSDYKRTVSGYSRTIAEYELRLRGLEAPRSEEERQDQGVQLGKHSGVQLVSVRDEESAHIKREPELSVKQEQLQQPLFSPVCVKSEDDKSVLHQRPTEEEEGAGPGCSSEPRPLSHSDSDEHSSDEHTAERERQTPPHNSEYVVKPHRCPECGKRFLRKDHLQGHMIIHTGERPHKCSYCDKTFIRQNHLKTHLRNHTGERPYSCPFCNRGFTTKALLTPHMRIHTGDRPFRCSMCDKGFIQRSHLKAHVKTHSREKTFTCLICQQVFYKRGDLMVHSRLVHPE